MSAAAGAAGRGAQRSGGPRRLVGVPGCAPNRVNDLLLLRPEPDGQSGTRDGQSGTRDGGSSGTRDGQSGTRDGQSGTRDGGSSGTRDGQSGTRDGQSGTRDGGSSGTRDGGSSGTRDGGSSGTRDGGSSGTRDGGSSGHVVFFHGDIQNFQEEMGLQPEAAQWLCWSLEQVARVLGRRFPNRNIWVVKASRMHLNKFSCYQNFVDSNMFGAPEHSGYSAGGGAFHQLRSLLTNAMERANLPPAGGAGGLTLVGFSKGCVVLNQLVYELPGARADPNMAAFVRRISDMFWLDGGHPGGSGTWVTDREALRALAASRISVHAHVTPYEVRDPMRAWVGREYGLFIQTLEELGAWPSRKLHFQDEPPSIQNHFRVILEF